MALLVTLSIITVLIAGGLELNRRVRAAVVDTAATRDRLTLTLMASSGIHAAMAMLIKDKSESPVDSLQEDWANPEKIAEVIADIPFDAGQIGVTIIDELGKIQVNALIDFPKGRHFNESQKIMWDRFTRLLIAQDEETFKDVEATAIINSVKDWLDSGDDDATTGLNGAEAEYYQGLDPPYMPANGPFMDINELSRVKGIIPELFRGTGPAGLEPYVTVYGMTQVPQEVDGKDFSYEGSININTADLPVLIAMMPSENTDYAQAIFDYRNEKDGETFVHDLSGDGWYKNVPEIPSDFTIDPKLIRNSSDVFRIQANAQMNDIQETVTAVIQREQEKKTGKWTCRILRWQVGTYE
ncbi:general secretion pathway protein GspK [Desulfococcus sp.]|uniref:general secretion pathway protein GspK n=1 Tax=Desulfococcus sp. TaxID=2025834 RepID=UPI0035942CC0